MYKLILFDLDGTILNTLADLNDAVNYGLINNGLPGITIDTTRSIVGNGIKNLCNQASKGIKSDYVYEDFKSYYANHLTDKTTIYDGIVDLLKELKKKYKLGILSNKKDSAVKELNNHFFGNIFDFAYGERDGIKRKPDREAIDLIMREYNINNDEILYIGDSEVDIIFSKNADIDYIICSWGFRNKKDLLKYNPKIIIDKPEEILKFI